MNIYRLSRVGGVGYDEYDAFVVAAASEGEARKIADEGDAEDEWGTWTDAGVVACALIGRACSGTAAGVVLGSFNAG